MNEDSYIPSLTLDPTPAETAAAVEEIKNEEMQKLYDSTGSDFSALAEQIARDDLDYIKEGERVFVNVTGD